MAVPRKLSITPWGHEECVTQEEGPLGTKWYPAMPRGALATVLIFCSKPALPQVLLLTIHNPPVASITLSNSIWITVSCDFPLAP